MIEFIADIGANHNGDIARTKDLILLCKNSGFTAVKFQAYDPLKVKAPEHWALPLEWLPLLYDYCSQLDIQMHCTPCDEAMAAYIEPYVDELKIGSYELDYPRLLAKVARSEKPIAFSTGGAIHEEIERALNILQRPRNLLTMYYCVPQYPAKLHQFSTNIIKQYQTLYGNKVRIGYSDHTTKAAAIMAAAIQGVERIEMHVDMPEMDGFESQAAGHVWSIKDATKTIELVDKTLELLSAKALPDTGYIEAMRIARTNNEGVRG